MENYEIIDNIITCMYEVSYWYEYKNINDFTSFTYINPLMMNKNGIEFIINTLIQRDNTIKIIEKENNMNYKLQKNKIIYKFNPCFYIDKYFQENNEYIIKISIISI